MKITLILSMFLLAVVGCTTSKIKTSSKENQSTKREVKSHIAKYEI